MNEQTDKIQGKIRQAIQRLHERYHKNPWIFMTEADIQCALYSELFKSNSKSRKSIIRDNNEKKIKDWEYQILTRPIHAEFSSHD